MCTRGRKSVRSSDALCSVSTSALLGSSTVRYSRVGKGQRHQDTLLGARSSLEHQSQEQERTTRKIGGPGTVNVTDNNHGGRSYLLRLVPVCPLPFALRLKCTLDVSREYGPYFEVEVEFDPRIKLRKEVAKLKKENARLRENAIFAAEKAAEREDRLERENDDLIRAQINKRYWLPKFKSYERLTHGN